MYAKKSNKVYQIETMGEMQKYLAQGFDIYNEQGEIIKHNASKTIAYSEYERLLEENKVLRKSVDALSAMITAPVTPDEGTGGGVDDVRSTAEEPPVKTLHPSTDDGAPKMGGRRGRAKAVTGGQDGGAVTGGQDGGAETGEQDGGAEIGEQDGDAGNQDGDA